MDTSQVADKDAITPDNPYSCSVSSDRNNATNYQTVDGNPSMPPTIPDGYESSGGVSLVTVVAPNVAEPLAEASLTERPCSAWSSMKETASLSSEKQSKEGTYTVEKTQTALKTLKRDASSLSAKTVVVRKRHDPLMTKFKFSLHKYNKSLKAITESKISLKYMHEKLVMLREELLLSGMYKVEELEFDNPDFIKGNESGCNAVENLRFLVKTTKIPASSLTTRPLSVRKKNNPLLMKFKISLQKYNKALKAFTDSETSLRYLHDKLVKLREKLLLIGVYKEEELMFDSGEFKQDTKRTQPSEDHIAVIDEKPTNQPYDSEFTKLGLMSNALGIQPSEHHPAMIDANSTNQQLNSNCMILDGKNKEHTLKLSEVLRTKPLEDSTVISEEGLQHHRNNSYTKLVCENEALALQFSEVLSTQLSDDLPVIIDVDSTHQQCNSKYMKLVDENKALSLKLSELERRNRDLENAATKYGSRGTSIPSSSIHNDYHMTKSLRNKIKSTNAKALETEAKLEELKLENADLKKQLFQSKTDLDHVEILHMQAVLKYQQAMERIEDMKREVELEKEETIKLNEVMSEKLQRLKIEFETFNLENETFRKLVQELKQDYNDSLAKCKEASKTWETVSERYALQKQMKDSIASDFVKLGVSYKKLQAAFNEMMADKEQPKEHSGCRKKSSRAKRNHVPSLKRAAVQTSSIKISPISRIVAMVGKKLPAQHSGDGPVEQLSVNKAYHDHLSKMEREMTALREENANYEEKHKLLMRQVMRLNKQCHLHQSENRRQLRLAGDLRNNTKHLEEEVTALRNKLQPTEAGTVKDPAKKLPSRPSSTKTRKSRTNYVAARHGPSKTAVPHSIKRTWLRSLWSKDNKPA